MKCCDVGEGGAEFREDGFEVLKVSCGVDVDGG